ncbi:uncharacterized protein GGS25DRAFT_402820 [Hypoxylon fragiforme]|uniref:uncharacterized protein n=1 Tax=Hypoxylon fragiforme TaxID=63214 RepID=UPI0020C6D31E|nr:uncharacterized protein GGS25DRAFT_402820 [Hypoxylon fragiforme]KAI2604897.1 hypothetical protein GGS25DRAFT_402820 [Hypoxylon fragiforme]
MSEKLVNPDALHEPENAVRWSLEHDQAKPSRLKPDDDDLQARKYDAAEERDTLESDSVSITTVGYELPKSTLDLDSCPSKDDSSSTSEESSSSKEDPIPRDWTEANEDLILDKLLLDLSLNGPDTLDKQSDDKATDESENSPIDLDSEDTKPHTHITNTLNKYNQVGFGSEHDPNAGQEQYTLLSPCRTQPGSVRSVYFDAHPYPYIYRWRPGTRLTWSVDWTSFPGRSWAVHAVDSLRASAHGWNRGLSNVWFEEVGSNEIPLFLLTYGGVDDEWSYACAFFPSDPPKQRKLRVFDLCFEEPQRAYMSNIFYHELGHILGLRHEFAQSPDEPDELARPSMFVGQQNPSSVMNYHPHPSQLVIQPSDYDGVQRLYDINAQFFGRYMIKNVDLGSRAVQQLYGMEAPPPRQSW